MRYLKMKRLAIKTGVAMSVFTGIAVLNQPISVFANTSEEILQEKEKVNTKIKKIKENMRKTEQKIDHMRNDFETTEKEINGVYLEKEETEERIEKRKEIIGNRLVSLQLNHGSNGGIHPYVQVVLGSDSFSDFISRMYTISKIIDADRELIETQKKDIGLLQEKKIVLINKKNDLENKFQSLQEEYEELQVKKTELEALSLELEDKLSEAKREEERARRLAELQKQTFNISFSEKDLNDTPPTEKGLIAIEEASKYLGGKYVWGGSTPKTSFDCSGYTQWAFKKAGIKLPRTAAQQYLATKRISAKELIPGDLVFFSYGKGIAHVGIYIGDGKMMNAQNSGIKIARLSGYWK